MAKVKEHKFKGGVQYWFWCPGCECSHAFTVPPWVFNDDLEKPSFTPSLLCNQSHPDSRCHSWVTDGMIKFFDDCHHSLANKTVPLPDYKLW